MTLPEERVPFPVAPAFRIRPDMRRWPADDRGHLRLDVRYPAYLEEKLRLLTADPAGCRVLDPAADPQEVTRALLRAADGLAADAQAERAAPAPVEAAAATVRLPLLGLALDRRDMTLTAAPARDGTALPVPPALAARARAHLAALPPLERLADALALAVQEDLVVIRERAAREPEAPRAAGQPAPDEAGADETPMQEGAAHAAMRTAGGRAELLHVCFPSAWDPAGRAGASFAELHAPVPHGEVLRKAAPQVVRAMVSKGPFVRYVWSLAPDGRLDRNPRRHEDLGAAAPPERLWFRVERQTVMPLPGLARALFTIRVYMAPLTSVLTGPERAGTLASAIASMDAPLRAYKGVGEGRDALLAWLRGRATTGR